MTGASIRVTRTLKAQPEQVFEAWTKAELLQKWLVPDPGVLTEVTCDPVVGGRYRLVGRFPDGADEITGEYLVVDPPHRLVFTWSGDNTSGQVTRISVTLDVGEHGDTTELTIVHERLPETSFRTRAGLVWDSLLDKLERLVLT